MIRRVALLPPPPRMSRRSRPRSSRRRRSSHPLPQSPGRWTEPRRSAAHADDQDPVGRVISAARVFFMSRYRARAGAFGSSVPLIRVLYFLRHSPTGRGVTEWSSRRLGNDNPTTPRAKGGARPARSSRLGWITDGVMGSWRGPRSLPQTPAHADGQLRSPTETHGPPRRRERLDGGRASRLPGACRPGAGGSAQARGTAPHPGSRG